MVTSTVRVTDDGRKQIRAHDDHSFESFLDSYSWSVAGLPPSPKIPVFLTCSRAPRQLSAFNKTWSGDSSFVLCQQFVTDVMKPLSISDIIDNEVQNLSGGELQRVAITLSLGKPADIYLIDEPSAYLDSEQVRLGF